MQNEETLLTIGEVADKFQVHVVTIRRWWASGLFVEPIKMPTRAIRWRLSEIEEFIANAKPYQRYGEKHEQVECTH